jgi:hypothetical protein
VALLQVPHLVHQLWNPSEDSGMTAVIGSLGDTIAGRTPIRLGESVRAYAFALEYLQLSPWPGPAISILWLIAGCAAIVAVRFRRDLPLLAVVLLPQLAAVAGYALWLGDLEAYYYVSLMPAAVLTVVLAVSAVVPQRLSAAVGGALLVAALLLVPGRLQFAATLFRMPQYETFVRASRVIVRLQQPMRAIRATFPIPPTSNPEFIFTILGGRIQRGAPWWAEIMPDSRVVYHQADDR